MNVPLPKNLEDAEVSKFLDIFGAKPGSTLAEDFPSVFEESLRPTWSAFVESRAVKDASPNRALLYTILRFLSYMKGMQVNPFKKEFKKLSNFKHSEVVLRVLAVRLNACVAALWKSFIRDHLPNQLIVSKHHSRIDDSEKAYTLVVNLVLSPRRKKESLDSILHKLETFLYNGPGLPLQLQTRFHPLPAKSRSHARSALSTYKTLILSQSSSDWLQIERTPHYSTAVIRAKEDCLVMRCLVSLDKNVFIDMPRRDAHSAILKTWSQAFKELK